MLINSNSQKGSVLVYILIAVALFAALGYAVAQMMRSGGENITSETKKVYASEVLDYAKALRHAVQTVQISNGCRETQVSFERSPFDGSDPLYVNSGAPSDLSCHVFHPDGGGANYMLPSAGVSANPYFFTGVFGVTNQGSNSDGEISMILRGVSLDLCTKINAHLDLGPPEIDPVNNLNFVTNGFQGSFAINGGIGSGLGSGNALYDNQPTGCFFENNATSGEYFFYQVLLAR